MALGQILLRLYCLGVLYQYLKFGYFILRCPHCSFVAVMDPQTKCFTCENQSCLKVTQKNSCLAGH